MKTKLSLLSILLVVGCSTTEAESAGYEPAVDLASMSEEEVMAMMMEMNMPGEPHAMFEGMAGVYDVEMEYWMQPGAETGTMSASSNIATILGGRYVMERFQGEFMGQPFEGLHIMGYDNLKEEYFSLWMDNMSTHCSQQSGNVDESGALRMSGMMYDAISPDGRPYRSVTSMNEDGSQRMEMYDTLPDGTEWMVMVGTYRKR